MNSCASCRVNSSSCVVLSLLLFLLLVLAWFSVFFISLLLFCLFSFFLHCLPSVFFLCLLDSSFVYVSLSSSWFPTHLHILIWCVDNFPNSWLSSCHLSFSVTRSNVCITWSQASASRFTTPGWFSGGGRRCSVVDCLLLCSSTWSTTEAREEVIRICIFFLNCGQANTVWCSG
jgi:hypothetical protein